MTKIELSADDQQDLLPAKCGRAIVRIDLQITIQLTI